MPFSWSIEVAPSERSFDAAGNKIASNINKTVGKATGNEKLEAEGDAQQLKGRVRT